MSNRKTKAPLQQCICYKLFRGLVFRSKKGVYSVDKRFQQWISDYEKDMQRKERSDATVEKYVHATSAFGNWLEQRELCKNAVIEWKKTLSNGGYSPVTVNTFLSAVNGLFRMIGREDCCVSLLKVQHRIFRDPDIELNRNEYEKLVSAAMMHQNQKGALLMEAICSTGIRVSEVSYITVEAAKRGRADIQMKGKVRTILLPGKLSKMLLAFAKKEKITSGPVFRNRRGQCMTRRQIWEEMKKICALTGVDPKKVFPHNLRHLFARAYYKVSHDIVRLADLLGHSSIETTRIYLMTTGEEHLKQLESMKLLI